MLTVISSRGTSVWQYAHPLRLARSFWTSRELIRQLVARDIVERYNTSLLGFSWSILSPLALLAIYTFVFSTVLHTRWPGTGVSSPSDFAVVVFAGLVPFSLFSEVLQRAPELIVSVPNYVRKSVFPVEMLPVSILGSVLVQSVGRLGILLAIVLLTRGHLDWTVVFLPVVLAPLLLLTLGLTWILASLGVFLRDIAHSVGLVLQLVFFATPIVYPLQAVPETWSGLLRLNPLTAIVEAVRAVVLWGAMPDWAALGTWTIINTVVAFVGYLWFMRVKSAFADVL